MLKNTLAWMVLCLVVARLGAAEENQSFTVGGLKFARPEKFGWVALPPGGMRAAQLEVKGEDGKKAEVVFFFFGAGGGGGVQANIDRWLGMFQEGKDKINAKTEKVERAKGKITFVQAEGTYLSGMPGGPKTPQPGSMMQGAIVEAEGGNVFVRMTGPAALVQASREGFRNMIDGAIR